MKFKVLGPLEVVASGRTVTPQATKIRSLIALLCVHSGTIVSRDYLVHALWSDNPPHTARTALQVYVSKLRKTLDAHAGLADRLITKPSGYLLELETGELDVREFDALSRCARIAADSGRLDEALRSLQAACSLWRGRALADLRGSPAFDSVARQLDERRIDVLERRIDVQLSLGQHRSVIGELYGLIEEYPTWEAIHSQLMISLYRSGRVGESLKVYRKIRDSLVREIGMEPGTGIRRLHQSILARDPALDVDLNLSIAG
jgi:SARP family transcriptional regulator, regulator of embCAB operon